MNRFTLLFGFSFLFILFGVYFTPDFIAVNLSPFGTVEKTSYFKIQVVRGFSFAIGLTFAILCLLGQKGKLPLTLQQFGSQHKVRVATLLFFSSLFFLGPILITYAHFKEQTPFKFFAADTFYYTNIAKNFAEHHFFTFDTLTPTNGFHPLWEYSLAWVYRLGDFDLTQQLFWAFALSVLFVWGSVLLFSLFLYQRTHSIVWSLATFFPGYYYFLAESFDKNNGNIWSFANGMETPFSLFWGSLFLFVLHKKWLAKDASFLKIFLTGFLLALITLARLDDIFLYGITLLVAFSFWTEKRLAKCIVLALPGILLIGAYLLYNYNYSGMWIPVSGRFKNGLGFVSNLFFLVETFFPFLTRPLDLFMTYNFFWNFTGWRIFQMIVPAGIAVLVFKISRSKISASSEENSSYEFSFVLPLFCGYILLKFIYNFLCVGIWHQGQWYYPLSLILTNIIISLYLHSHWEKLSSQGLKKALLVALLGFSFIQSNIYWLDKFIAQQNYKHYLFFQEREKIIKQLNGRSSKEIPLKLLSYDDGILAYALNVPTLNGLGFAMDAKSATAKKNGELLKYAYQEGYTVMSSLVYNSLPAKRGKYSAEEIRQNLARSFYLEKSIDLNQWDFNILYQDPSSGAIFIQFKPK